MRTTPKLEIGWGGALLFVYAFSYFLPGASGINQIAVYALLATGLWNAHRDSGLLRRVGSDPLWIALLLLEAAVIYACLVSPDPVFSLRDARKPVFLDTILVALSLPLALAREDAAKVSRALIDGFVLSVIPLLAIDARQHYVDLVVDGFKPFSIETIPRHREFSQPLVVILPFMLIAFARVRSSAVRILLGALLAWVGVALLATLARGAWVAAVVVVVAWAVYFRAFRPLLGATVATGLVVVATLIFLPDSFLAHKLTQTDSSYRLGHGVLGATLDLILDSPLRGYGFGDEIYAEVYNAAAPSHPEWTVPKSMGPHNMALRLWFFAGLPGLIAILWLYFVIFREGVELARRPSRENDAAFAVFLVFLGAVFVRGLFENGYLNYFGLVVGILILFRMKRPAEEGAGSRAGEVLRRLD